METEVFYFVENCLLLIGKQMKRVKEEFLAYLTSKGFCQNTILLACSMQDLSVTCGPEETETDFKRSTGTPQVVRFKFKIVEAAADRKLCSYPCVRGPPRECNAGCVENVITVAKQRLEQEKHKLYQLLRGDVSTRKKAWYSKAMSAEPPATLSIGGFTLIPKGQIQLSTTEVTCETGMEMRNTTSYIIHF